MPEALERIARLRSLLPADTRVQVDGGINAKTARAAREAGADLLVAGSAVFWNDDPAAAYADLVGRRRGGHACLRSCSSSAMPRPPSRASRSGSASADSSRRARRSLSPTSISATGSRGRSDAMRRRLRPSPVQRSRSQPAVSEDRAKTLVTDRHKGFDAREWERTWTAAEYRSAIEEVRSAIARGDVYQVNLVQHLWAPFSGDPACARRAPRAAPTASPDAVRSRCLDRGLRFSRALPRPSWRQALDDADQGHAPARRRLPSFAARRRTPPST